MKVRSAALLAAGLLLAPGALPADAAAVRPDPMRAAQWGLAQVRAPEAWAKSRGKGVVVAIIDSGIDLGHPDLRAKLVRGMNFVAPHLPPQDDLGHGTHVAGVVAAATNNGIGIAGVAPDARLMPLKVLDKDGNGTLRALTAAIRYATAKGAKVINMSLSFRAGVGHLWGELGDYDDLHAAIEEAWRRGVVVVATAGNEGVPLCNEPATYERVVCVGALGPDRTRPWYSQSDATMTDWFICAPGGAGLSSEGLGSVDDDSANVLSTVGRGTVMDLRRNGYVAASGTSMAAPHVAGVAALLAARKLTNAQIVARLLDRAVDLGAPGRDPVFGSGALDAVAALR